MARSKSPLSTPSDKSLAETPNGSVEAPEVLTLDEAAACLRVGQAQVLEMITGQGLPARKFGTQ